MEGKILIDTLHISYRYPKSDAFKRWSKPTGGMDPGILRTGVAEGNFVIRSGANGYAISLWQHDARIYLTPETDDFRGEDKGMGILIQLGPKFLIEHTNNLQTAVKNLLLDAYIRGDYEMRITRLDMALDLFGVSMKDQNLSLWAAGWVGRSKVSSHYFNSRTGDLETITIGSRKSSIYVRVYDKIAQATAEGDIMYWLDVWKRTDTNVTRIEWEVKPRAGNFGDDLKDFKLFCGASARELMIYLLDWGRLCVPDPDNKNRTRWKETEFWQQLRSIVKEWSHGIDWPTSRYGKQFQPISEGYIKYLSGSISGGMARFGKDKPSIVAMLEALATYGENLDKLTRRAEIKATIYKNLYELGKPEQIDQSLLVGARGGRRPLRELAEGAAHGKAKRLQQ